MFYSQQFQTDTMLFAKEQNGRKNMEEANRMPYFKIIASMEKEFGCNNTVECDT